MRSCGLLAMLWQQAATCPGSKRVKGTPATRTLELQLMAVLSGGTLKRFTCTINKVFKFNYESIFFF